ncbi:uncharacterized protein Z520_01858 [Fonsecaea multimorphosa CBS 102226]|uniref:MmgE/PrpD family protein n=1 Tax=Fonsecaea multimorphosa CBS 102226 TaxID=1442371 RepID=A0A0D2KEE4_9EURO|nr:uncharacterized protein Z520_01858 [Fonsecaea multimorphosa CBS 102226]KIY01720.1 hypothetical protein Z520_01858 [Fonsecaea multimorphosa CBS 102226]OAL29915.1 hypothetical protein AYO22_01821 [Fonsecaea multimorphosa]
MPHASPEETVPGSITRQLAEFVYRTTWDDIQPIRNVLECGLLDYIGLASYAVEHVASSPVFIEAVNNLSATGPGSVLGLSRRYQAQYSALLNGTLVHSMDWDDTNSVASLHPGASAISAALAQAELEMSAGRKVTGREFLTAVAVGYEVTCRLGRSISDVLHRVGFHPTCVAGVFGASATAGKLAGFDASQIEHLFGVVGSMASGSLQCFENGGWNKRFHPGIAAHNALLGVQFVKAGMVGAARAIDGKRGLLHSYARLSEPDLHIVESLGTFWETSNTAIKPYPSCRLVHGPIEAAYALRKQFPDDLDLDAALSGKDIEVTIGPKAFHGVGSPAANKFRPTNVVEGQFSLYFQFAVAWLYGSNAWDSYQLLQDEKVLALCRRIKVHVDDSLRDGSLVTVAQLGDKCVKVEYPLGEPENPIGLREVERLKFLPMAEKVYGVQGARDILALFYDLENQDDLSVFTKALRT